MQRQVLPGPVSPCGLSEVRPWCPCSEQWVQGRLLQGCCEDELSNAGKVPRYHRACSWYKLLTVQYFVPWVASIEMVMRWSVSSVPGMTFPKVKVKVAQSCPTLCDPKDYTVHGILQARILEGVAFPFSRGFSHPGIEPRSPASQADSLPAEL